MSYEPDTNDIRVRQLKEEIAKIREEQFARGFPTNQGGGSNVVGGGMGISAPATGTTSWLPNVIRIVKDTGIVDRIAYDGKNVNKDFEIGETVTGQSSGATAVVGDIDITGTTTGFLFFVQGSITGSFTNDESLNGSGAGGNNIADFDDSFGTTAPVGRGHLNAGSASIIVDTRESPAEIHFIDNAQNDGQLVLLRAQNGLTIRVRRAQTNDGNTGNLDLDESFNLTENALVFLQFQSASNVTPDGGWVPLISEITTGAISGGSGIDFPILYPKENLGTQNGVIDLALNQNDGHYKQVTLDGDASITFSNLPPATIGFKFYLLTIQDGVGGHVYTDLPNSVLFEASLLSQLQTAPTAQTLWQFSTADGGLNWHANVIQSQGSVAGQTPWLSDINANTFNLFNLDVLRYAKGIEAGADSIIGFGVYGSAVENDTKLKWSIPASVLGNPRFYEWQFDLNPAMALRRDSFGNTGLDMLDTGTIDNTGGISFIHQLGALSSIVPDGVEMRYDNGFGTGGGGFHGFRVANQAFPQFEIREEVIRANKNLDMITNDIVEIDRARFTSTGGFNSTGDHGDRLIAGGNSGIQMNIPRISPFQAGFNIYFENAGKTDSDLEYEFFRDGLQMHKNPIQDTLGVFFSNGGSIVDLNSHIEFNGGINTDAITPQTIKFVVKDFSFVNHEMFELTGSEDGPGGVGGGMKMLTDLNMQTQNIHNIDIAEFEPDVGLGIAGLANGSYGIVADETGTNDQFVFSIPITADRFAWMLGADERGAMLLEWNGFGAPKLTLDSFFGDTTVQASEFIIQNDHTLGTSGMLDGFFRMVGGDVIVGTGSSLVNLSTGAGGTSFIGFNADDDLRMNTFNITGLDVLRFQVDGGVIGFGEYGISADAGDFSMNFSVPDGKAFAFHDNLDPIAFLNSTGLNLLSNTGFPDPALVAREIILQEHSIGTSGQNDGQIRVVGGDVIVGSGSGLVNLTTLSAGGADNLGNHLTLQSLDMNSTLQNFIINFTGMTSFLGHTMFWTPNGMVWNLDSLTNDSYSWLGGGSTPMMTLTNSQLNVENKRITNVSDPTSNLDAVNLQTLNTGFVTTNTFQSVSAQKDWLGIHAFLGAITSINSPAIFLGDSTSDILSVTARIQGNLIPTIGGNQLGEAGRRWDVRAEDLQFSSGSTVDEISNSITAFGSDQLMTAEAIQNAILAFGGGGGSFVTTNTTQTNLSGNKTWVGSHTFDSGLTTINGSLTLGNSVADLFNVTGRFLSPLIPLSDGVDLGSSSQRWDLFGQNMSLASGSTVANISNSSTQSSSSALMTANAIQTAISNAGGGGVQLGDSPFWTGSHVHNGSTHSINSSAIFLGNSTGDVMLMQARVQGNIIPTQDGNNLGDSSRRWDLFGQSMSLASGNTVSTISNSTTAFGSSTLMTATAIQNAILSFGGGGGVEIGDSPTWTGFHQWQNTATFQSVLNVSGTMNMFGTLNHDGARVGFYGTTPQTRSTGWSVSGGPDDRTLFVNSASTLEVAEVLGTLIRQLERIGLIQ